MNKLQDKCNPEKARTRCTTEISMIASHILEEGRFSGATGLANSSHPHSQLSAAWYIESTAI